ncbi:MAG: sensor histidine kinase [Motilibacteraceae bacterium]
MSEEQRVQALRALHVLDRPEDRDLSLIVRTAAQVCGAASATINLIDDEHQHQVAVHGDVPTTCPRTVSMCAVTLAEDTPVEVRDASEDLRFSANPFVTGELGTVRFYAAHQLWLDPGLPVGTLCVYDDAPHEITPAQSAALHDLAAQAVELLRLRRDTRVLGHELAELHHSNAELSSFAATVAHDLRSPLAALRWSLEMTTGMGEQVGPRTRELVDSALLAAVRMQELVTDLLQFAEVGAAPSYAEVDLDALVAAVLADLPASPASSRGNGQTLCRSGLVRVDRLPTVRTDPAKIRRLVQNLVLNAVKYAAPTPSAPVQVCAAVGTDGWSLKVVDHGPGIPAEHREHVLVPFTRLPSALEQDGHGIGLATCLRSVTALGGTLEISDTPGGGATVTATFPPPPADPPHPAAPVPTITLT